MLSQVQLCCAALGAQANPQVMERARKLLAESNPKQAFVELAAIQSEMAGNADFDYLLGVAALDSTRYDDAIIAFERVLAVNPNHAGAQMDLARAYFALGSYDLARATFLKLREANPPAPALQAINQYLEAIEVRKRQLVAGWSGTAELTIGYDSNLTGVPADFGAASLQAFNIAVDPTGNAIKRKAAFFEAQAALEYHRPFSRGWSGFVGGGARGRAYRHESDFNLVAGDLRAGVALNQGPQQWRISAGYQDYNQKGAAPGDPRPTNDRDSANVNVDWRRALDARTQVGAAMQASRIRFPDNPIDDFDQVLVAGTYLRSFEGSGVPLLSLSAFASEDRARNKFPDGVTDKSKNLAGLRSYFQYAMSPRLELFSVLGFIYRRDTDSFARSTAVEHGRDRFAEATLGLAWQFREKCAVRTQWSFTHNDSTIDIFDFRRHEVSTGVRCDLF
jgi:tetratricopeptide (TPR) repeat protein